MKHLSELSPKRHHEEDLYHDYMLHVERKFKNAYLSLFVLDTIGCALLVFLPNELCVLLLLETE